MKRRLSVKSRMYKEKSKNPSGRETVANEINKAGSILKFDFAKFLICTKTPRIQKNVNMVVSIPESADHENLPLNTVSRETSKAANSGDLLPSFSTETTVVSLLNISSEILYIKMQESKWNREESINEITIKLSETRLKEPRAITYSGEVVPAVYSPLLN